MSLTSPLGLARHLRRPELRMDTTPWLNVLALAWMLMQLNSSYIYAPGIVMDLASLNLPTVPANELSGQPTDAVVLTIPASVKQSQLFLLNNGGIYQSSVENDVLTIHGLQDALTNARKSLRNRAPGAPAVLLLKADASLTLQVYHTVAAMAKAAGFTQMVEAENPIPSASTSLATASKPSPPASSGGNISAP